MVFIVDGGFLNISVELVEIVSGEYYTDPNIGFVFRVRIRGDGWEFLQRIEREIFIGLVDGSRAENLDVAIEIATLVRASSAKADVPIIVQGRNVGTKDGETRYELAFLTEFGEQAIFVDAATFDAVCATV